MKTEEFKKFFYLLEKKYIQKNKIILPNEYYLEFFDFLQAEKIYLPAEVMEYIVKNCSINEELLGKITNNIKHDIDKIKIGIQNVNENNTSILQECLSNGRLSFIKFKANESEKELVKLKEKINELEEIIKETQKEIYIDFLTRVYNRKKFHNVWEKCLKDKELYLAVIDVDNFKQINDSYGHLVGDLVLKKVIDIISKYTDRDNIYRFGGDEFILIFEENDKNKVKETLESIYKELNKKKFKINGKDLIKISISCGVTYKPSKEKEIDKIFEKADEALYESKHNGKNTFSFH